MSNLRAGFSRQLLFTLALVTALAAPAFAQIANSFTVTGVAGVAKPANVPMGATMGAMFTITAPAASITTQPPTLNSITVAASGTGNDLTGYAGVSLYEDTNNNSVWDVALDLPYGTSLVSFPADNGNALFSQVQQFAGSQVRRYFIVVKFNATPLPTQTFDYRVSAITANIGSQGLPTVVMLGFVINGTLSTFTFADASAAAPVQATLGSSGNVCQSFTVNYLAPGAPADKPSSITATGLGTANETTDLISAQLWYDSDNSGAFTAADTQLDSQTFAADNGTAVFSLATHPDFTSGNTRRFFVVYNLNLQASANETFKCYVSAAGASAQPSAMNGLPAPGVAGAPGLVVNVGTFTFADVSAGAPLQVNLGTSGNVCQAFTIAYPAGPADKPSTITVTGLGRANELADLAAVQLWHDADNSGSFSSGSDTLVDTTTFPADNGAATFNMAGHANFTPGNTRRFFVVYNLNLAAGFQEIFKCYVSAAGASANGATFAGLPSPNVAGTAGLVVIFTALQATFHGPAIPATVNCDTAGPSGDGALLCDATIASPAPFVWDVFTVTFEAAGTGTFNTAFGELALYEDNGSTFWDGAGTDTQAAATLPGFSGGSATFTLSQSVFAAASSRRFFLVGKLNGSAVAGQTFGARLASVTTGPNPGPVFPGFPTVFSAALVIDLASLTISAGPNPPLLMTHKAGGAQAYVVGRLRLAAVNSPVVVSAIALSGGGTGDWATDIDVANGVQVYRDDGDGVFNAADTQIYQGGGAATMNAVFAPPVNVPNSGDADLWLEINLTATAGMGVATPETFSLAVGSAAAVSAGGGVVVLMGTPAPIMTTLRAVEFRVDSFAPLADLFAGGKAITITGSGFVLPFVVRIGGVVCLGTPAITGGTQVTGLNVPAGTALDQPIEIQSGALPSQTLTETFDYSAVPSPGPGPTSGCAAAAHNAYALLPVLIPAVLGMRRRRK